MNLSFRLARMFVVLALAFGALAQFSYGQCGTYFHPGYRAIGKIGFLHNSYFHLDDWTGDGKSDYWNFQANGATHNILIYPSKPTGYWDWDNPIVYSTTIPSSASLSAMNPLVLDFDGDGRKDMLYSNRIYRNTGSGSLETLAPITISDPGLMSGQETVGYYDVTGDGRLDWVYVFYKTDATRELRFQAGTVDGSFAPRVIILPHDPQNDLNYIATEMGDFDGDGKLDIMIAKQLPDFVTARFTLLRNTGNGIFQSGTPMEMPGNRNIRQRVRDYNGDGRADVFTDSAGTGAILYGQANGTLSRTVYSEIGDDIDAIVDLNNDSRLDFLVMGPVVGAGYAGYATIINDGSGGYVRTTYSNPVQFSVFGFRIEDVTGDGKADYVENWAAARERLSSFMPRNVFNQEVQVVWANQCQPSPHKFRTLKNDLTEDAVMWDPGNSTNWIYRNVRVGSLFSSFHWGEAGDVPSPGDFDGDGVYDFAVYRDSTGYWYALNSSDSTWNVMRFGLPGDKPVPNDYDGDGKTDLAVFRPSDGTWHIWFVGPQHYQSMHFGLNGDKPVPADYDGDFKTDVAVYRPSDGNWYYIRSSDSQVVINHWGIDVDVPVPADFDGDAKADLAVFRSGIWYVLGSNGNTLFTSYGLAGDIPVPMSENGYVPALTVYRPSNRTWYGGPDWVAGSSTAVPVKFGLPNN